MVNDNDDFTHFGYQQVPVTEKGKRVHAVFDSVATNYDRMNDVMSLGVHRLWKRQTVHLANLRKGMKVLDVASGTGDLVKLMVPYVGSTGQIIATDVNASMLHLNRARLTDANIVDNVSYVIADAEQLSFTKDYFDRITIAFGLRNVTHQAAALQSMYRCLKPGGILLVLEFSKPILPLLNLLYDAYSFKVLPKLGQWIAHDAESYQYLAESIRMHPDQLTLQSLCLASGFDECHYLNFSGGIVALHRAYKF